MKQIKNNLIGISGKVGSGKDTVGSIIKLLNVDEREFTPTTGNIVADLKLDSYYTSICSSSYEIKKFAGATTRAFKEITGINYHTLSREEKEKVRPLYVKFAEGQKAIFEPNVWVNALFAKYKLTKPLGLEGHTWNEGKLPSWIITDVRFENEAQAIKDRGGIVIRVNRPRKGLRQEGIYVTHPSETALDNWAFDYVIENNGSIAELVEKVKQLDLDHEND